MGVWNATWIDEVEGVVVFTFKSSGDVEKAKERLSLLGYAENLVHVRQQDDPVLDITLREKRRPVIGGFQISYSGVNEACSAGFNVYKKNESGYPDASLGRFLITASHCTTDRDQVEFITFGQPVLSDPIGTEVDEAPTYTSGYECTEYILLAQHRCQVDVAVIQYHDSVSSTFMQVATASASPSPYTTAPNMISTVSVSYNQLYLFVNMAVRKVGRTSGQTDGAVLNTCVTSYWPEYPGGNPDFVVPCAVTANYVADGGDSGGAVYVASSPVRPAGLHMGSNGSTKYFNYVTSIESALGWTYYFY